MKISDLIRHFEEIQSNHGDLEVLYQNIFFDRQGASEEYIDAEKEDFVIRSFQDKRKGKFLVF